MQKLETRTAEIYYPAQDRSAAIRIASRLEHCMEHLRTLPIAKTERAKGVVILTTADFNNSFVVPPNLGHREEMVLAHHLSFELFNELNIGVAAIGDVSCHEAVHYVHLQQTNGLW